MKKVLFSILGFVVVAGLVTLFVVKQQSGYTKVLTAKLVKEDLSTIVSGTGKGAGREHIPSRRERALRASGRIEACHRIGD